MTFAELETLLPNGFHDAFLCALSADYVNRTAEMELEIWVGDLNADDRKVREAYRCGRLHFSGLLLFSADVPSGEWLEAEPNGVGIDLTRAGYNVTLPQGSPDEPLPEGAFFRSFYFTQDANSFLRVAAHGVNWTWLSEPRTIY